MSEDPWAKYLTPPDDAAEDAPLRVDIGQPPAADDFAQYLTPPPDIILNRDTPLGMIDAFGRGAADTASFGTADEISAGLDTALPVTQGAIRGDYGANLRLQRGIDAADEDVNPGSRLAGQFAGAVGVGMLTGRPEMTLRQLSGRAAAEGAAYGAGSGEDLTDRLSLAGQYGVAGGLLAPAVAVAGGALGRGIRKAKRTLADFLGATDEAADVMAAADRQGVTLNAADVRPGLRGVQAMAEGLPITDTIIRSGIQRNADSVEAALLREAEKRGTALDNSALGDRVEEGARKFIQSSRDKADELYTGARELAADVTVKPEAAAAAAKAALAEVDKLPNINRAKRSVLKDILLDLIDDTGASKEMDVDTIRRLRTEVRESLGNAGLRGSNLDRQIGQIIDGASDDLFGALQAKSPEAARAFREADDFYKQRVETIDNALEKVLGKRGDISPEQITARLNALAGLKGNTEALDGILNAIPADARGDVAATLLTNLGRRAPDAEFSVNHFITQVDKLSPRARTILFGKDGQAALNDLRKASGAMQDSLRQLNATNSGKVVNYMLALLGGGAGYAVGGVGGVAGMGALGVGAGKLLTSPVFARWLARAPTVKTTTAAFNHAQQLGQIAANVPAIRGEAAALQQSLLQVLANDNAAVASRAAAAPPEDQEE